MNSGESSLGKGKRPRISSEIEEIVVPSSDEERQATSKNKKKVKLPEKQAIQNKNISTKPFSEIWDYYEKGAQRNNGHYEATCSHCKSKWSREKPQEMEAHLANKCLLCPEEISRYWCERVATRETNYTRNSKLLPSLPQPPNSTQSQITDHYSSDQSLPKSVVNRLDKKVLKAWVIAGIPFNVIENPFILDLFKDLKPGYSLPSRTTLSECLMDEERSEE